MSTSTITITRTKRFLVGPVGPPSNIITLEVLLFPGKMTCVLSLPLTRYHGAMHSYKNLTFLLGIWFCYLLQLCGLWIDSIRIESKLDWTTIVDSSNRFVSDYGTKHLHLSLHGDLLGKLQSSGQVNGRDVWQVICLACETSCSLPLSLSLSFFSAPCAEPHNDKALGELLGE
jgi:hypothetical protein